MDISCTRNGKHQRNVLAKDYNAEYPGLLVHSVIQGILWKIAHRYRAPVIILT